MNWNYRAPWWLPGGNAQTIFAAKLATRYTGVQPTWHRERWVTPDSDFIDVDWLMPSTDAQDKPLLVLFHGLEGSSQSHYAEAFADEARRKDWQMAVPHFRGCSGEINRAPRAYHSGDDAEVGWVLEKMRKRHSGPIYAVGVSLGGNALMCWAGEMGHAAASVVNAVASVSAPLDLTASGHAIDSGLNRQIYARMFLKTMKPGAMAKLQQYPGLFDANRLLAANTLYAFDDVFTAPVHGYKNADDYWYRASAKPRLRGIQIPALALNAKNDPFVPESSLPTKNQVSNSVTLWQPDAGGHVGFTSDTFPSDLKPMPEAVMSWMTHG